MNLMSLGVISNSFFIEEIALGKHLLKVFINNCISVVLSASLL